jgi:two-component system capsular synthesis sensor histidine kinase RcsC
MIIQYLNSTVSAQSILIADDSEVVRQLLTDACATIGCEMDVASDGDEALRLFTEKKHSFVLTDYILPSISGVDLVIGVRRIAPAVPCLIFTGHPDDRVRRFTEETDNCWFMVKPLELIQLVHFIIEALNEAQELEGARTMDSESSDA